MDLKVYTRNRVMRMLSCCKQGSSTVLKKLHLDVLCLEQNLDSFEDFAEFLIAAGLDESATFAKTVAVSAPVEAKSATKRKRRLEPPVSATTPDTLPVPKEMLYKILSDAGDSVSRLTKTSVHTDPATGESLFQLKS